MEFTFNGILEELEKQLSAKSEWKKTLYHGVYRRINSVIAYVLNKFVYLTEFYYKESSWDLATQRESLMARTEYYWYNPHRKIGAQGRIELIGDEDFNSGGDYIYTGNGVVIPAWTQFTDEDEDVHVYSTERRVYYNMTEGAINIPVKEGIPKEFIYIAEGKANEVINLNIDDIDDDEIYVYLVNSNNVVQDTFIRCEKDIDEKLFFITNTDNYYCSIKNNLTMSGVLITFGDGIKSRQIELGDRILVKYAQTKGNKGNITTTGKISKIKNELVDAQGNEVDLYVRNTEAISNGADYENIESIRNNASNLFNTGYRLGGYDDWKVVLESDSRIFRAMVWSTDDHEDDSLTLLQNKVFLTAIGNDGSALTETTENDLEINLLKPNKSPTEVVQWQSLRKVYAIFNVQAVVENIPFNEAIIHINNSITDNYATLNTDFRQSIFKSNHYSVIEENSFIINHITQMSHLEKVQGFGLTNHIILPSVLASENSNVKEQVYLIPGSVSVWVRLRNGDDWGDPIRIGYEENNIIVGDNDYDITDSAVIHNLNTISFIVNDFITTDPNYYEICLVYRTQDGEGNRQNDIRLYYFDLITDVYTEYNTFELEYE